MNLLNTKHLLFDLGGVIINIDPQRTHQAFAEIAKRDVAEVAQHLKEIDLFGRYEVGEWNDQEFRQAVRTLLQTGLSDEQIDSAWNALLLDIPPARIDLLKKLREQYNLLLLSNTNPIHIREVNAILHRTTGVSVLEDLFDTTFYSFRIRRSKPKPDAFQYILDEAGIRAEETLFLDDSAENIQAAQQLGIQTVLITPTYTILDHFSNAWTKA